MTGHFLATGDSYHHCLQLPCRGLNSCRHCSRGLPQYLPQLFGVPRMANMLSSRHQQTPARSSSFTRARTPSCSLLWWMRATVSGWLMWGLSVIVLMGHLIRIRIQLCRRVSWSARRCPSTRRRTPGPDALHFCGRWSFSSQVSTLFFLNRSFMAVSYFSNCIPRFQNAFIYYSHHLECCWNMEIVKKKYIWDKHCIMPTNFNFIVIFIFV